MEKKTNNTGEQDPTADNNSMLSKKTNQDFNNKKPDQSNPNETKRKPVKEGAEPEQSEDQPGDQSLYKPHDGTKNEDADSEGKARNEKIGGK